MLQTLSNILSSMNIYMYMYLQLYMYSFCAIFCTCGQKPKAGQIWFYYLYAENQIMFGSVQIHKP